jgi:hypothetical protein
VAVAVTAAVGAVRHIPFLSVVMCPYKRNVFYNYPYTRTVFFRYLGGSPLPLY